MLARGSGDDVRAVLTDAGAILRRNSGNERGFQHMAKGIAHREWRIDRDDYRDEHGRIDDASFRAAVQNELALAEHIGERLGVAIVAAPIRTRPLDGHGDWFTVGWAFRTATVPSATPSRNPEADALANLVEDGALGVLDVPEPALVQDPDELAEVE